MANGKSYTETVVEIHQKLSSLETISQYQENHLSNIDQHLNKLNERTDKNETANALNEEKINSNRKVIWYIGVPILLCLITATVKLCGAF